MKKIILLLVLTATTLLANAKPCPAPWDVMTTVVKLTDPIITHYSVEGGWEDFGQPTQRRVIRMYVETDYAVNYQQIVQFQILKWQQISYGFPRHYTWAWVWNVYTVYIQAGNTWGLLDDTFEIGEDYDYFNYNAIGPTKFP